MVLFCRYGFGIDAPSSFFSRPSFHSVVWTYSIFGWHRCCQQFLYTCADTQKYKNYHSERGGGCIVLTYILFMQIYCIYLYQHVSSQPPFDYCSHHFRRHCNKWYPPKHLKVACYIIDKSTRQIYAWDFHFSSFCCWFLVTNIFWREYPHQGIKCLPASNNNCLTKSLPVLFPLSLGTYWYLLTPLNYLPLLKGIM